MAIELTSEQLQAAPLRISDPETSQEYVLIRAELYDRLRQLLDDDVRASGELVDRIMAEDDANDPYLQSYQSITKD